MPSHALDPITIVNDLTFIEKIFPSSWSILAGIGQSGLSIATLFRDFKEKFSTHLNEIFQNSEKGRNLLVKWPTLKDNPLVKLMRFLGSALLLPVVLPIIIPLFIAQKTVALAVKAATRLTIFVKFPKFYLDNSPEGKDKYAVWSKQLEETVRTKIKNQQRERREENNGVKRSKIWAAVLLTFAVPLALIGVAALLVALSVIIGPVAHILVASLYLGYATYMAARLIKATKSLAHSVINFLSVSRLLAYKRKEKKRIEQQKENGLDANKGLEGKKASDTEYFDNCLARLKLEIKALDACCSGNKNGETTPTDKQRELVKKLRVKEARNACIKATICTGIFFGGAGAAIMAAATIFAAFAPAVAIALTPGLLPAMAMTAACVGVACTSFAVLALCVVATVGLFKIINKTINEQQALPENDAKVGDEDELDDDNEHEHKQGLVEPPKQQQQQQQQQEQQEQQQEQEQEQQPMSQQKILGLFKKEEAKENPATYTIERLTRRPKPTVNFDTNKKEKNSNANLWPRFQQPQSTWNITNTASVGWAELSSRTGSSSTLA